MTGNISILLQNHHQTNWSDDDFVVKLKYHHFTFVSLFLARILSLGDDSSVWNLSVHLVFLEVVGWLWILDKIAVYHFNN